MYQPINLSGFERREQELKKIERYATPPCDVPHQHYKLYRSTDWLHSWRVKAHLESILPLLAKTFSSFNIEFARRIALTHDDLEIMTGDVQLYRKEQMTDAERSEFDHKEIAAMEELCRQSPFHIDGSPYRELLQAAKLRITEEAQVVSYCDKFDGFGEALHEVFAGNRCFLRPVEGAKKDWGYIGRLGEFEQKYPLLKDLLQQPHPMFRPPRIDFEAIVARGKPHTAVSIVTPTGYAPYDCWKANVMRCEEFPP